MKNGIKMFLLIFLSITAIITAVEITALIYLGKKIEEAVKNDMSIVVDIADKLVTDNINDIYKNMSVVFSMLEDNPKNEWGDKLNRLNEKLPDFIGISVIDKNKNTVLQSGVFSGLNDECIDESIKALQNNIKTISTTHLSNHNDKLLVFHVSQYYISQNDSLLVIGTIDGMHFSNMLKDFTFWESGHLNMNDRDGFVLANSREEWVKSRKNFIIENPKGYEKLVETVKNMTLGKSGITEYTLNGIERIVFYRPVSAENLGWSISLVAPKNEGQLGDLDNAAKIGGLIGILLGFIVALINGFFAVKNFNKIEKLKDEAINTSEEKSRFLSNMSHEMRTPLNAIIGFSALALDSENIDEQNKKYAENIHNSGTMLLELINDILDLSKIEAGKYEIVSADYYCASVINDVISTNIVRIGSKDIDFRVLCEPKMFAMLNGDSLRVKQIFNNILSNAIKYTNEGFIEWKITTEQNEDGVYIVSSIEDSGVGIKKDDLNKIFLKYLQVNTKSNRKTEGTGLGLTITKKLLEFMDGDIKVESVYGKGTKFSFRFKQGFVSDELIGKEVCDLLKNFKYIDLRRNEKSRIVKSYIPYAKVLVVDDVAVNLDVAKGLMKPYGMKVDTVMSGKEAIELIRKEEVIYDAIFMDHMMPEMDGIEAVKIIREIDTEYAKKVPIIALTANAMVGSNEKFLNAGFDDFLSKPIDIVHLDTIINTWCRNKLNAMQDT